MAPIDILNFLTAAAPVVASVASAVSGGGRSESVSERSTREVHNVTNNITVTYNNHFYINSPTDAAQIVSQMQKQMPSLTSGETRYLL